MAKHYSIEKEASFGLDIVIMGPGVCEVLAPETKATIKELEILKMLDAAFEAGAKRDTLAWKSEAGSKMIVSSKFLPELILGLPLDSPVEFARMEGSADGFMIAGHLVGICNPKFEAFSVPNPQARYLAHVVRQLKEQPITLVWTGGHFTFTDFVI